MGRKVGARKSTKVTRVTSAKSKLIEGAIEFQRQKGELITWERRMTLLNFSSSVCGPETHPNEIMQFAGKFERFVLTGEVPTAEVTELTVTPKEEREAEHREMKERRRNAGVAYEGLDPQ